MKITTTTTTTTTTANRQRRRRRQRRLLSQGRGTITGGGVAAAAAALLLLWTLASPAAATTTRLAEECTLDCPVDAPCTFGEAVFSHSNLGGGGAAAAGGVQLETNWNGMHCACPPGWTGLLCDHKYESCSSSSSSTTNNGDNGGGGGGGGHGCFHGGKCVEDAGWTDAFGNPQLLCDCSTAQTTTDGGIRYVGKYCETPFEKSCHGAVGDDDGSLSFCVNGADCNPNYENDGIPCLCPDGWEGYHCEFKEGTVPQCDLQCLNGGNCIVGVQSPDEVDLLRRIWSDAEISDHMRCICPSGFGGPLCAAPLEACGSDSSGDEQQQHACYHGGSCVTTTTTVHGESTTEHHCDCTTATDSQGNRFAGDYCQEVSTVVCSAGGGSDGDSSSSFFCTNGGTCPFSGDPSQPCSCPEGYSGHRCEYDTRPPAATSTTTTAAAVKTDNASSLPPSEPCGGGEIFCLNGSQCISRDFTLEDGTQGTDEVCDCSTAHKPALYQGFAGEACQYKSTSICSSSLSGATTTGNEDDIEFRFCVNGGTCQDDASSAPGSLYCSCPTTFTGTHCEIHAKKDPAQQQNDQTTTNPDENAVPCGDTVCFHGGKCVETKVVVDGGTTVMEQYCDCQSAVDAEHLYAGKSCEFPSTSLCSQPVGDSSSSSSSSLMGSFFCTNHGRCASSSSPQSFQQGCQCQDGFEGFHCEFLALDQDPNEDDNDEQQGAAADGNEGEEEECGDLVCKNGGTCVSSIVKEEDVGQSAATLRHVQHCDCSTTATETTIFAGAECEHEVTEFCTEAQQPDDSSSSSSSSGGGLETTIFCVQGGKCNPDNVFEGCDCSPGWTGFRCEFAMDLNDLLEEQEEEDDSSGGATPCGDNLVCYHGGVCEITQQVNNDSGNLEDVYLCDCSTTATTLEIYGGPTCSYKSTSICQPQPDSAAAAAAGAAATAPLSRVDVCFNHGICLEDNGGDQQEQACDCPSGFTGSRCQFEVEDDLHADQGEPCGEDGEQYCYNGGQCVTTKILGPNEDTTIEYHCDCSSAFDETHLYAGDSCQFKSTVQCTHSYSFEGGDAGSTTGGSSLQGNLFCVNGGSCKDNFEEGCDCPSGWTGFFCEFEEDPQDVIYAEDLDQFEPEAEPCGDNVCLNGGSCVSTQITTNDGTKTTIQYCDCNMAYAEDTIFAGPNCEYQASTLCTLPADGAPNLAGVDFCVNGGKCNQDNRFGGCLCDETHWTGMRCELKIDDVDDNDESVAACGNIACLNGGRCIVSLENDVVDYSCDCSSAFDDLHLYDGPYCQYQSTQFCTRPEGGTLAKVEFCVNDGQCQDNGTCRCPAGYYGPRCELTIYVDEGDSEDVNLLLPDDNNDDGDDEYNCRLSCFNGGTCVKGVKDLGSYEDYIGNVGHLNQTYDETYFEHCVCPQGFVGLTCEHKVETCGDGDHYCLHGSTCVKDNDGHICDCSQADETIGHGDEPSLFAGDSCEHPANDICLQGEAFPTRPLFFCVNGGTCRGYVSEGEPDPGCACRAGWAGPHCETRSFRSSMASDDDGSQGGPNVLLISLVTLLLVVLLFILIVLLIRTGRRQKKDGSSSQDWMIFRRRRGAQHQLSEDPASRSSNLAPKRLTNTNIAPLQGTLVSPTRSSGGSPGNFGMTLPPDEEPMPYQDEPSSLEPYQDEPGAYSGYHDDDDDDNDPKNVIEECYSDDDEITMVNVGPARDEDGNQLHNVDFV